MLISSRLSFILFLVFGLSLVMLDEGSSSELSSVAPDNDGTLRRIHVPVLMYHYVGDTPAGADIYRQDLTISTEAFREQLAYLKNQGYETVNLDDLHDALMAGERLPAKPVVLTFDDGYSDHHVNAWPILTDLDYEATFFVITDRADESHPAYLNWDQIMEMADSGMRMQSHTKSHPDLRNRDYDFLVFQLLGSLESLEVFTGQPVTSFSYPAGQYDDMTLTVLKQMPIQIAVTTQHGAYHTSDGLLEIKRLRIRSTTTVESLAALIERSR